MALKLSYSLAELDHEGRYFGKWDEHRSEETADARMGRAEDADAEAPAPGPEPQDTGFEDARWSEDDYLNGITGSKDFGSVSRLDPVVMAPGAPSEKTDDEVMKKLLKHVEDNKEELADNSAELTEISARTSSIQGTRPRSAVIAPEDGPRGPRRPTRADTSREASTPTTSSASSTTKTSATWTPRQTRSRSLRAPTWKTTPETRCPRRSSIKRWRRSKTRWMTCSRLSTRGMRTPPHRGLRRKGLRRRPPAPSARPVRRTRGGGGFWRRDPVRRPKRPRLRPGGDLARETGCALK